MGDSEYKYNFVHQDYSDDKLKQIAKDLYHGLIFSDKHCNPSSGVDIAQVFMPLVLSDFYQMHYDPNLNQQELRELKLERTINRDVIDRKATEFLGNIGFIYEYMSAASPMGVNGYPTFFSMRFLHKDDTEKMLNFYDKYKGMMDRVDESY